MSPAYLQSLTQSSSAREPGVASDSGPHPPISRCVIDTMWTCLTQGNVAGSWFRPVHVSTSEPAKGCPWSTLCAWADEKNRRATNRIVICTVYRSALLLWDLGTEVRDNYCDNRDPSYVRKRSNASVQHSSTKKSPENAY